MGRHPGKSTTGASRAQKLALALWSALAPVYQDLKDCVLAHIHPSLGNLPRKEPTPSDTLGKRSLGPLHSAHFGSLS